MNNSSVVLQPIHTKALVPFLPLPQKSTKEYYRAWAHGETSREIWKPWRKWEKGKTTNYLYYPLFSFDPEYVFILISSNYRSILHYRLHGVWSLLVLKKNVDTLLVVTEEASPKSCSGSLWKESELFSQPSNPRLQANPVLTFSAVVMGLTAFSENILTKESSSSVTSPLYGRFYGQSSQMWHSSIQHMKLGKNPLISRFSHGLSHYVLIELQYSSVSLFFS